MLTVLSAPCEVQVIALKCNHALRWTRPEHIKKYCNNNDNNSKCNIGLHKIPLDDYERFIKRDADVPKEKYTCIYTQCNGFIYLSEF